jgi:hypothetical protein
MNIKLLTTVRSVLHVLDQLTWLSDRDEPKLYWKKSVSFEAGDVNCRNTVIILNLFVKDYVFDGTPPVTLV